MLRIEGLKKRLEHFSLIVDSLKIEKGKYFVILGPSGSGKTTLLEIIVGFIKPEKGRIFLNEKDITNFPINKRKIVMCHGRYLFPHMTVEENIAYGIKGKRSKNERNKIVKKIAEKLNILHLLSRKPETLSMGEGQRVALARALVTEPEVILFDEPLNSLDRLTHEELLLEVKKIHEETGITFLHVTHDFVEAISLGEEIAIINKGKIEQKGKIEEILFKPRNKFVAEFVGVKNLISGEIFEEKGKLWFRKNGFRVSINRKFLNKEILQGNRWRGKKMILGIRPEDIFVISDICCRYRNENVFQAEVKEIYPLSLATSRLVLQINGLNLVAEVLKSKLLRMGIKKGDRIFICLNNLILI